MKQKFIILFLLVFSCFHLFAQPYQIGHRSTTYNDPFRNRDIPAHIYYPSNTSGDNVAVANGSFPLLVFGHGFVMAYSAYKNFWDSLVPLGYIMIFPTTEGSLFPTPDHGEFGEDLNFLNIKMKSENTNTSSPFYQKISDKSAIMGHSMGGGASFLAAAYNTDINALITFAAANTNTNPSSIDVCPNISVPSLIFYGANDGVASPTSNQLPMYNALGSSCKTIIGINGGGHCYFANYNLNCYSGEIVTTPQPTISREEQHKVIFDFLTPYLNFILKDSFSSEQVFIDSLNNSSRITFQRQCINTQLDEIPKVNFNIYPNPLMNDYFLTIYSDENHESYSVKLKDYSGRLVFNENCSGQQDKIDLRFLSRGLYFIYLEADNKVFSAKILLL
ncbi:MAG: T9SS type A sorting domain-containing protein [Bacteroidales bacterium]|nr:T9SS type A sorting domain-containing protein [Bacteroidales bacterium]